MRIKVLLSFLAAIALVFGISTPAQAAGISSNYTFLVGWNNAAKAGSVDSTYPNHWQPYPNGISGKYYSDEMISLHDGLFDIGFTSAKKGVAGTFGSKEGAWNHVGGTFSMKAKMTGSTTNGVAVMLWPTSGNWTDGEIDFPEGNLSGDTWAFHHWMQPGLEGKSYNKNLGNLWKSWHVYTIDWKAGQYVKYYVDDVLQFTVTQDVPTTPHRYMIQTSGNGTSGHFLIDWVRTTE